MVADSQGLDVTSASTTAKSAVVNNYLKHKQIPPIVEAINACEGEGYAACIQDIANQAVALHAQQSEDLTQACTNDPTGTCLDHGEDSFNPPLLL